MLCAQDSLVDEPVPDAVERAAPHCVTRLMAEGVMQAPGAVCASGGQAGANAGACVDAFVAAAGASGQLAADSGTGADSEATVEAKPEVAPDVTASVTVPVFVEILPDSLALMQRGKPVVPIKPGARELAIYVSQILFIINAAPGPNV